MDRALVDDALMKGFHIDCVPFIVTHPLPESVIARPIYDYARQRLVTIFTSVAAVTATFQYVSTSPDWTAFAISGATKSCLSHHLKPGSILGTAIDARQLAQVISARAPLEKVVFFCGDRRSPVIPDALSRRQFDWQEQVVYTTTEISQTLNKSYDAYLFFSPSAVQSFFKLHEMPEDCPAVAIGASTAVSLRQFGVTNVLTAGFPDQEHVLEVLYSFFEH